MQPQSLCTAYTYDIFAATSILTLTLPTMSLKIKKIINGSVLTWSSI
jgi:hypothetical protein